MIPFNKPYVSDREQEYAAEAIASRHHSGNQAFGKRCMDLIRERLECGEVFLTPSGTSALEMGALLADIGAGDEVILPSFTFSSTATAILLRGARPVFCEVDPRTMNIDVEAIERLITKRTRMIAPIDYAGIPCDIDRINDIARAHDLVVLQDAAQAFDAIHADGTPVGAKAPLAAFSFHETKNISCGEGGALIVNDPALVERAHFLQDKGTDRRRMILGQVDKYQWVDIGSSYLLSDILSAVLLAQIERSRELVAKRGRVVDGYRELLAPYRDQGILQIPEPPPSVKTNHHAFFVIFDSEESRGGFLRRCQTRGVCPVIGYVPLHGSSFGQSLGYKDEDLPLTASIGKRIARLPLYADLADDGFEACRDVIGSVLLEMYGPSARPSEVKRVRRADPKEVGHEGLDPYGNRKPVDDSVKEPATLES